MRSRTIKPSFFDNEELFDAEDSSGLPLRVAFAGLWCYADREGRFKWEPRRIKAAILPHDQIDGAKVLEVLLAARFISRYVVDGVTYGHIPTFRLHQPLHKWEQESKCPPPPELTHLQGNSVVLQIKPVALQTEREEVAGNNNNSSRSNSSNVNSSSSNQERVQGEPKSAVREVLSAEPGGARALEVFCKTVENADGYLEVVAMAIDGTYGPEFRITPAEAVVALRDWAIKKIPNPSPKVLRGFLRSQRRETGRVESGRQADEAGAASSHLTSAEKIQQELAKRPA